MLAVLPPNLEDGTKEPQTREFHESCPIWSYPYKDPCWTKSSEATAKSISSNSTNRLNLGLGIHSWHCWQEIPPCNLDVNCFGFSRWKNTLSESSKLDACIYSICCGRWQLINWPQDFLVFWSAWVWLTETLGWWIFIYIYIIRIYPLDPCMVYSPTCFPHQPNVGTYTSLISQSKTRVPSNYPQFHQHNKVYRVKVGFQWQHGFTEKNQTYSAASTYQNVWYPPNKPQQLVSWWSLRFINSSYSGAGIIHLHWWNHPK